MGSPDVNNKLKPVYKDIQFHHVHESACHTTVCDVHTVEPLHSCMHTVQANELTTPALQLGTCRSSITVKQVC